MTMKIGVGGAWKAVPRMQIGVGGAWKNVAKAWIGVGGVWKECFTYGSVALSTIADQTNTISPSDATTSLTLANTGGITTQENGGGNQTWLTAGSASDYECRLTQSGLTGGSMGGAALATWLGCGTSRTWSLTNSTNGNSTYTFTGTLEIRDVATSTVQASCSVTLSAIVEV